VIDVTQREEIEKFIILKGIAEIDISMNRAAAQIPRSRNLKLSTKVKASTKKGFLKIQFYKRLTNECQS